MHNPRANTPFPFPPEDGWDHDLKVTLHKKAPGAAPKGKAKGKGKAGGKGAPPPKAATAPQPPPDPAPTPKAAKPPAPTPPAKRAREEPAEDERFGELRTWLLSLDPKGTLMPYFDKLVNEFDGDLRQIAAARIEDNPRPFLCI